LINVVKSYFNDRRHRYALKLYLLVFGLMGWSYFSILSDALSADCSELQKYMLEECGGMVLYACCYIFIALILRVSCWWDNVRGYEVPPLKQMARRKI